MCDCSPITIIKTSLLFILTHVAWHILYLAISFTTVSIHCYLREKKWYSRLENQRHFLNARLEGLQRAKDVIKSQERIYERGEEARDWFLRSIEELDAWGRGVSGDEGLRRLRRVGDEDDSLRGAKFFEFV